MPRLLHRILHLVENLSLPKLWGVVLPQWNALDWVSSKRRSSTGLQTCPQGQQRVKAKARLHSWLTRREGDQCGVDAAFRRTSLSTCSVCVCRAQFGGGVGRAREEEAIQSVELEAESAAGAVLQPVPHLAAVEPRRQEVASCPARPQLRRNSHTHTHTHTHTRLTAFCPRLPGWAGTRKVKQSGFYWSKRQ